MRHSSVPWCAHRKQKKPSWQSLASSTAYRLLPLSLKVGDACFSNEDRLSILVSTTKTVDKDL